MAQGYGDRSSYSTYPTDKQKYEYRTRPFEGFFVSSVEFCKFEKFNKDDIKDNITGTQGPRGPDGSQRPTGATRPQGIQSVQVLIDPSGTQDDVGAQGSAGIGVINNTNLYLLIGNTTNTFLTQDDSTIFCYSGDVVFVGGFFAANLTTISPNHIIVYDEPLKSVSTTPFGYQTVIRNNPGGGVGNYSAFAWCFDNPPAHIP